MKRYFIIRCTALRNNLVVGLESHLVTLGGYFSRSTFITELEVKENVSSIAIQTVTELNESDYNDYIN